MRRTLRDDMAMPTDNEAVSPRLPDLNLRIEREITRLLYEQDIPGIVTNYGAMLLAVWLHWRGAPASVLLSWLGLWLACNTVYLGFHLVQRRHGAGVHDDPVFWRRLHVLFANVVSVAPAGWMPWFLRDVPDVLFLNTALVIVYAAGVYASNAMLWPLSYVIGAATVLAPLAAVHAAQGSRTALGVALALGAFYVLLIPFAQVQARALRRAIRVGFENEELAARLARQTARAEREREAAESARAEALAANRAKARFLAAATHDLRQPLHALSLTLSAMESPAANTPDANAIARARDCTNRLASMFDALLDQARLDAGTRTAQFEWIELGPFLRQVEMQFQPLAEERGLWFRCRPASGRVNGDRLALWRIVSNLVTNALDATEEGGVLVAWRARTHTLEVRDSGRGIEAIHHRAVFEEFRRFDGGRAGVQGLGLGLATVDRLARLMNARVALRSAPGKGSVFGIVFAPESVAASPDVTDTPVPADAAAPVRRSRPGARVLAVDDDPAVLDALESLLRAEGWDARLARGAADARAQLQDGRWRPELVILDRRLGDGDGLELARQLGREIEPSPVFLIVTGDTAPEALQELLASGLEILHKPVVPDRWNASLARLGF
ncbi:MAG: response regulator [Betaproteobacteria bacterium]|nr:response regulator [Betaproteobacteria bacterium]